MGPGEMSFVYDGCSVTFRYASGRRNEDPYRYFRSGERLLALDFTELAERESYYRAAARWSGDGLMASSFIAPQLSVARWDGERFVMASGPEHAMRRITEPSDLDDNARAHLCVRRRVPTEEEVLRHHGFPIDADRGL